MTDNGTNKAITVSFTGYRDIRTEHLENGGMGSDIISALRKTVRELYDSGFRIFQSGMARGFDLIAAEVVASMKTELPDMVFVAVFPYGERQSSVSLRHILTQADKIISVSENYHDGCFHQRNDYLVDNCSVLVCYYDGQPGGTHYTVRRAIKRKVHIINILKEYRPWDALQLNLPNL